LKPFLILQLRPIDAASENEFEAFLKYGGLRKEDVHRIRMEKEGVPEIDLSKYAGIIEGGGPSNVSDPIAKKSKEQLRFEKELQPLYDQIFEHDFPFLGACYGIGSLADYSGTEVSRKKYAEPPGVVSVSLSEAASSDPLLSGIPKAFNAYVGHKEAVQELPKGATLLASSETCPIQMIRFKKNIYATQFHPELDFEGLSIRVGIYMYEGYFNAEDADKLLEANRKHIVDHPERILKNFVERYKTKN